MLDGLVPGLVASAVIGAVLLVRKRSTPPPITGLVVVGVFAVQIRSRLELILVLGLALLAIVPGLISAGNNLFGRALLALPGAALIGFGTTPGPLWLDASVTTAIAVGGALAADMDDAHPDAGVGTLFLIMATIGAWLDIPDVDRVLVLLGAALPVALLVWPRPLARAGASAHVWVGALIWVAVDGGVIRLSAVVGTTAALGLLLIEPLVRRSLGWSEGVFTRLWSGDPAASAIAPTAAQAGVALLASRGAGLTRSTELSLTIAVVLLGATFALLRTAALRREQPYAGLD